MIATVELSDAEIADLRALTRGENAQSAVRSALEEYRRYARRMLLKDLSGKVCMDDNWRLQENAETDAPHPH